MGVQLPMSSGSRRNSSNPTVPSNLLKMSTQRSTAAVEGLAKTNQLGSSRLDMVGDDPGSDSSAVLVKGIPHQSWRGRGVCTFARIEGVPDIRTMLMCSQREVYCYVARDDHEPNYLAHPSPIRVGRLPRMGHPHRSWQPTARRSRHGACSGPEMGLWRGPALSAWLRLRLAHRPSRLRRPAPQP